MQLSRGPIHQRTGRSTAVAIATAIAATALAAPGAADTQTVKINSAQVSGGGMEPGLATKSQITVDVFDLPIELEVGVPQTFTFADIYTDEPAVTPEAIGLPMPIGFELGFDAPGSPVARIDGVVQGNEAQGVQFGELTFLDPADTVVVDGARVKVTWVTRIDGELVPLFGAVFNAGVGELTPGRDNGLPVSVRLEAVVPTPTALAGGLLGGFLMMVRPRRRG